MAEIINGFCDAGCKYPTYSKDAIDGKFSTVDSDIRIIRQNMNSFRLLTTTDTSKYSKCFMFTVKIAFDDNKYTSVNLLEGYTTTVIYIDEVLYTITADVYRGTAYINAITPSFPKSPTVTITKGYYYDWQ